MRFDTGTMTYVTANATAKTMAICVQSKELLRLSSLIRLGASLGVLNIDISVLNSLIFETGAYSICEKLGGNPQSKERDRLRAEFVREKLVK